MNKSKRDGDNDQNSQNLHSQSDSGNDGSDSEGNSEPSLVEMEGFHINNKFTFNDFPPDSEYKQ